jgi:hypothetical protein
LVGASKGNKPRMDPRFRKVDDCEGHLRQAQGPKILTVSELVELAKICAFSLRHSRESVESVKTIQPRMQPRIRKVDDCAGHLRQAQGPKILTVSELVELSRDSKL